VKHERSRTLRRLGFSSELTGGKIERLGGSYFTVESVGESLSPQHDVTAKHAVLGPRGLASRGIAPRASSRQRIVDYARRICMASSCRGSQAHQRSRNRQEEPQLGAGIDRGLMMPGRATATTGLVAPV
jgi:hypothetical protein